MVGDSNGNAGVRGYNRSISVGVAKAPAAVMVYLAEATTAEGCVAKATEITACMASAAAAQGYLALASAATRVSSPDESASARFHS